MALSGTLSDLGIVDLIQFPGTGKKTGELVIAGIDHEARLFYEQGRLKHVMCGDVEGIDAMVELVSWTEGEFEFRLGSTTDANTIEIDLHRALMVALKTRDEKLEEARKQELAKQQAQEKPTSPPPSSSMMAITVKTDAHIQSIITKAVSNFPYIEYASVFDRNGTQLCVWTNGEADETIYTNMISGVIGIFNTHPRKELQKMYLTDSFGTCIGSIIDSDLVLFLAAGTDSSLGVVSIAASKIANAVMERGE